MFNELSIKYYKRTSIEIIADISFILYLITEVAFSYSFLGRVSLVLFILSTILLSISRKTLKFHPYFIIIIIFILYNYLNIKNGYSILPNASMDLLNTLILNLIFSYFLYNYIIIRGNPIIILSMYVNSILIVTFSIVLFSLPTLFSGRLGGSVGINANVIATVASVGFLLVLFKKLVNNSMFDNLELLWFFTTVLLTGSRKGLLIVTLGIVFLLYYLYPHKRIKYTFTTIVLVSIILVIITTIPFFYNLIGSRILALVSFVSDEGVTTEASLNSRARLINQGWEYISDSPLRGHGLDSFRYLEGPDGKYSHNNFIELLVNTGWIGFIIYYIGHIFIVVKCYVGMKKGNILMALMFSVSTILLIMDYGAVTYYGRIFITLLIISLGFSKISDQKDIVIS